MLFQQTTHYAESGDQMAGTQTLTVHYTAALSVILCVCAVTSETVIVDDPLQGSTVGIMLGGTLTPEGYKPGGGQTLSHILYGFMSTGDGTGVQPEALGPGIVSGGAPPHAPAPDGYVQFEVKGIDISALPADADQGFLGMYDGRGIPESCAYFDDFKNNYFRWNVHWRENRNAIKGVVSCADATQERLSSTRAVYTDGRDWSAEPTGSGFSWDKDRWYTFKVQWEGTGFKVFVDGAQKWSANAPSNKYAPLRHRIWLGCAPGYSDKYSSMMPDIIYRNFTFVTMRDVDLVEGTSVAPRKASAPAGVSSSSVPRIFVGECPDIGITAARVFSIDGRMFPDAGRVLRGVTDAGRATLPLVMVR